MSMVDVVLVYPPSVFEENLTAEGKLHRYRVGNKKLGAWPPLGLMYLSAVLKKEGISCKIINPFVQSLSLKTTVKDIAALNPKIVGISVTTLQIRGAVQLARALKKIFGRKIFIVVGGPHISIDPDFVRTFTCFDCGISGEAELTFPKIVKKVLKKKKVDRIIKSDLPLNLDALPFPDRKQIKIDDYFEVENPTATMITSRGCPYNCLFCSRVAISDKVRFLNPKLVVDEIELIKEQYKHNFTFLDDTFTLSRTHTMALCREMIRRKVNINWSCNTRANLLDTQLVRLMKKAGCNLILIGIESGNENFRNQVVAKNILDKDIFKAVRICRQAGITVGGYFMLGFPGESKNMLWETASAPKKFNLDIMSIHATTIYPGSQLFQTANRESGTNALKLWYEYARGKRKLEDLPLVYIPKGIEFSEIEKARRFAYFKFYFRPQFILRQIWHDLRSFKDLKRDILQGLMLLRFGKTSKDLK